MPAKSHLNVSETKLIIFKPKRKLVDFNDMKIKLDGKRLYQTDSVKLIVN